MATLIRAEISENNKYWIDKHRHYELKHFCLQYPAWKKAYAEFDDLNLPLSMIERIPTSDGPSDPTAKRALIKAQYAEKINLVESVAKEADRCLYKYLLKGVTENMSYRCLKAKYDMPCGKDMYYDRYRRFFWLLSKSRN